MTGILFGTGIGPGDPELMTLKAVRLIRENDTIAVPGEKPEESIAYQIAVQAVPELAEKELVAIPMPMTKNAKELEENHRRGAEKQSSEEDHFVIYFFPDSGIDKLGSS